MSLLFAAAAVETQISQCIYAMYFVSLYEDRLAASTNSFCCAKQHNDVTVDTLVDHNRPFGAESIYRAKCAHIISTALCDVHCKQYRLE